MDALRLLEEFVRLPGPPGQEEAIRKAVSDQVSELGFKSRVDAKGNLLVGPADARIVVTAHLDEIAMICRGFEGDELLVGALGGLMLWKLGEGPVTIMAPGKSLDGVLSFGSIHTEDERSPRANPKGIEWNSARVKTGLTAQELAAHGVRPGTRIAVHPCRRNLFPMGKLVASHFLDDRADLVSWLLALESLGDQDVLFAATVAEEVGGEGALYLLNSVRPEICIALELGPNVPDAPVVVNSRPTLWVSDSYSTMAAADIDLVASCGDVQFQALSRGGSDASCAASHGHTARPFTLGLPMENSHGFEIIHRDSMQALADLTVNLITKLRK
jgi:putative aminopeptidase FrvX